MPSKEETYTRIYSTATYLVVNIINFTRDPCAHKSVYGTWMSKNKHDSGYP
uniref:Uncharacterized protein n=1 Tax=Arundo donax TaxID=35708 RepID=A0A0A9ER28_ARUDO